MPRPSHSTSKFLSLVLRHDPGRIGLALDENGWAIVDDLIPMANRAGIPLDRALLQKIVAENDKQRFAISADGTRIRANQGHSVPVDLDLEPTAPPDLLFHGTVERALDSIRQNGLQKRDRQHVHLSIDEPTATAVGSRRGAPVVLRVDAARMAADGLVFYLAQNGVWLTDRVPPEYLGWPAD